MSVMEGPMAVCRNKRLSDFGFTTNKLLLKVSEKEAIQIVVERIFGVSFDNGATDSEIFIEGYFEKDIISDSPFIFKMKKILGIKENREVKKITLKGSLYTQDFYSCYWPSKYIELKYLFEDIEDLEVAKIVPEEIKDILLKRYFKKDFKEKS